MSVPSTDGYVYHPQKHRRTKYQGTYPFSKEDKVKLDLWSSTHYMALPEPSSNEAEEMGVVPSFPYKDVLIYGDTANIMALYFRDIWGCLLTPKNVSDMADTSGIRYHVWIATKKVVDAVPLSFDCFSLWRVHQRSHDKHTLRKLRMVYVRRILRQFLFELGLAMLGAVKGSVIIFLDTRLHGSKIDMVDEARALVGLFDRADVRRWRVVITVIYPQSYAQPFFDRPQLPATEEGIRAAQILTSKYSINVHLSMVTSLSHACACIEAGASMLSMNVAPILTWFEKKDGDEVEHAIDPGHPGIKTIQSSINYIRQNSLNTSLLLTDIRDPIPPTQWDELKQLDGVDAAALDQKLLDQISGRGLTTWSPEMMEDYGHSPANVCAREANYPSNYWNHWRGFDMALSAGDRSLMSSVVDIRLKQNKVFMEKIEGVIKKEVDKRLYVDAFDVQPSWLSP